MSRYYALAFFVLFSFTASIRADTYAGRVLDPDDRPVPNARIEVAYWSPAEPGKVPKGAVSDAEGRFTIEWTPRPPADPAKAESPTEKVDRIGLHALAFAPAGLPLGTSGAVLLPATDNTLKLTRPEVYAGTLVDEQGKPLANVPLSVRSIMLPDKSNGLRLGLFLQVPRELQSLLSTRTDDKGAFRLERMPSGSSISVELDDPFLALEERNYSRTVARPVELRARRAGSISGRVLNLAGEALAGAWVVASRMGAGERTSPRAGRATTAADGSFQVPALLADTYRLDVTIQNEDSVMPSVSGIAVTAGQVIALPAIQAITPAWLTGTVLDARTSKPLYGAFVAVPETVVSPSWSTLTAQDGTFRLKVVPGRLELTALHPSGMRWGEARTPASAPMLVQVAGGETHPLGPIEIDPGETLLGQMVDEAGAPVPKHSLLINSDRRGGPHTTGDAEGRFSMSGLKAGTLFLSDLSAPRGENEWEIVSPESVTVPDQKEITVRLRRIKYSSLRFRFVTPDGLPVAGAKATFQNEFTMKDMDGPGRNRGMQNQPIQSEADGTFLVKGLTDDSIATLEKIEKDGYIYVSGGEITRQDGEFRVTDIVLRPLTGQLQGTVVDAAGKPLAGALVWSPKLKPQVRTDDKGGFSLPAADTDFEVWAAQGRAAAHLTGRGAGLKLPLQEAPLVPERDLARALPILREALPELDRTTAAEVLQSIAPLDPVAALEVAPRVHKYIPEVERRRDFHPFEDADGARRAVIQAWSQGHPGATTQEAAPLLALLDEIENVPDFVAASAALGIALAKDEIAPKLLKNAFERLGPAPELPEKNAVPFAHLAALAATIGSPDAERYFTSASSLYVRDPKYPDLMGMALGQGPAGLVRRLAAQSSPETRPSLMNGLPTSTRLIFLNYAIPVLAPRDPEAAYQLVLEAWQLHEDAFKNEPPDKRTFIAGWVSTATREVIRAYGPSHPELIPDLARRVQDTAYRTPVLALAAGYARPEDARSLLKDAQAGSNKRLVMSSRPQMNTSPQMQARLAAVAQNFDPTLAGEYLRYMQRLRAVSGPRGGYTGDGEIAFYLGQVSPEDARALLENEWAQAREKAARQKQNPEQPVGYTRISEEGSLALAMAPLDWERAVSWARMLEPKEQQQTLGRLARWALQTKQERSLFRND